MRASERDYCTITRYDIIFPLPTRWKGEKKPSGCEKKTRFVSITFYKLSGGSVSLGLSRSDRSVLYNCIHQRFGRAAGVLDHFGPGVMSVMFTHYIILINKEESRQQDCVCPKCVLFYFIGRLALILGVFLISNARPIWCMNAYFYLN